MKIARHIIVLVTICALLTSCSKKDFDAPTDQPETKPPLEVLTVMRKGNEKITKEIVFDEGYFTRESKIKQFQDRAEIASGKNVVITFTNTEALETNSLLFELQTLQLQQKLDLSSENIRIYYQNGDTIYRIESEKEGELFLNEKTGEMLKGYFTLSLLPDEQDNNLAMQMSGEFEVKLNEKT